MPVKNEATTRPANHLGSMNFVGVLGKAPVAV